MVVHHLVPHLTNEDDEDGDEALVQTVEVRPGCDHSVLRWVFRYLVIFVVVNLEAKELHPKQREDEHADHQ